MYYQFIELEPLYCHLEAQNRCVIKEANQISLVYLMTCITCHYKGERELLHMNVPLTHST